MAGNVIKKEPNEISKKDMTAQRGGKRKKVRPRMRWINEISYGAKAWGIKNWRMVALNGERWKN